MRSCVVLQSFQRKKIPKEAELFQDVYTPDIIPKQRFVAQNFGSEGEEEEYHLFSPYVYSNF